jgi:hypothetical protein
MPNSFSGATADVSEYPEVGWKIWICEELKCNLHTLKCVRQGCINHRCNTAMATKFCMVVPNICGFKIQNLLHVTLLMARIFGNSYTSGKFVHP